MDSEITFLLRLLNQLAPVGRDPNDLIQGMIIHRFLSLGLWVEFHPDRCQWYVHLNNEPGKWEE